MKKNLLFITFAWAFALLLQTLAKSCDGYQEFDGVRTEIINEEGDIRTYATQTVAVPINQPSVVVQAKKRAMILAKAQVVQYLEDEISAACQDDDEAKQNTLLSKSGEIESQNVDFEQGITTLCQITTRARDFVRGARKVGECYTPGKELMITVGISPKTISAAQSLKKMMNKSYSGSSKSPSSNSSGTSSGVDGFSRFENDF